MNRWEVSNFLDSRKGRDWIPDFVGERFDFGGLSTAVNMDNGLGKSSVTEAVLWMLSRDRELGRKTRSRLAPDSDGRFTHIRCEFVEPEAADLFNHGERLTGETWVFGYYGNRGEDYFYCYQGGLEECPVHLDESDGDGAVFKVCLPDDEFRASLSRFRNAVIGSARDWAARVRQMMSGAQLEQLVAYQKRGGGDKAASFYDVKIGRGERFDEAFFRQYVAPEILVGVDDFDDDADARGFDRKIVAQAQSVIDARIMVRAKAELIARGEANLAALRAVDAAARTLLDADRHFAAQADSTALAVGVVRSAVERWGLAGMPVEGGGGATEEDRHALTHGGWEVGGDLVIAKDWVDSHVGPHSLPAPLKIIDAGLVRVLPLSLHPIQAKGRGGVVRYVRLRDLCDHLAALPGNAAVAERVERLAEALRRHGVTGLRRCYLAAERAAAEAQAMVRTLEEERATRHGERAALLDQLTKFEANEAAYARMQGSGLFSEPDLADPLAARSRVEAARCQARAAVDAHTRRTVELELRGRQYDEVVAAFGRCDGFDALLAAQGAALEAAERDSAEARAAYDDARERLERLRESEDAARRAQAVARKAVEDFARQAADMQTFQDRFGATADPAVEAGRLTEERRVAQDAERAAEAELRAITATVGDLDRQRDQAEDQYRARRSEVSALEALEPGMRAFVAACPGRDAERFLAEERDRRRDGEARAQAAAAQRHRCVPLVEALDRFEAAHPGADPALWLADAEARRDEATVAVAETGRQIAKARADLEALRAFRVAPTETDDAAAVLIAALPHRPLHAVIVEAVADEARRAVLLDHFSAVLFAPVFSDLALAGQAARRLAEAGLPVPVLLESDLVGWIAADTPPRIRSVTADGAVVAGLFVGTRTPTVEAILDPEALERRLAETRARLAGLETRRDDGRRIVDALAAEGPACRLARQAAEAVAGEARRRLVEAGIEAEAAAEAIAAAEANLAPGIVARVEAACLYLRAGGDEALERARAAAAAAAARRVELERLRDEAGARQAEADRRLVEARDRARTAEAEAARWLPWCETARAFVAAGGAAEMERRRRAAERADDECLTLVTRVNGLSAEIRILEDRKDRTAEASRDRRDTMTRWREPLRAAAAFVESGAREDLARAPETLARLKAAEAVEESRLRFDFEAAGHFVAGGGAGGMEPAKLRSESLKARLDRIERHDLPRAKDLRDRASRHLKAVAAAHATAERAQAAILAAYLKVVDGGFEGISLVDGPVLDPDRAIAAGLTDRAIAAIGDDTAGLDAVAAEYEALAGRIGGFDLVALREGMKAAATQRRSARDQYEAAIDREVDPGRRLDAAIRHKLEGARAAPIEIAGLLATVDHGLAWERTLHAKAEDGLGRVESELVSILRGIAGNADVNLRRLKKVLAGGQGARIHLNVAVAGDEQIGAILERAVEDIESERIRFREDQARGRAVSEDQFSARLTVGVRETVYQRMFVKGGDGEALITIEHPTMREGRPFRFEKDGISGGQATALTLLWTIKLAEFSVVRETAALSAATRRRAGVAQHSIVIVDGLFSDLSKQELIDESMEAMQGIKGSFQLIGLIHSPYYRNNWQRFPTLIVGRKVACLDDRGRRSEAVAVEGHRLVRGRVTALTYGAREDAAGQVGPS